MNTYAVIAEYRGKRADFDIQSTSMKQARQSISKILGTETDWVVISILHV